jgi:hypothetical protein
LSIVAPMVTEGGKMVKPDLCTGYWLFGPTKKV